MNIKIKKTAKTLIVTTALIALTSCGGEKTASSAARPQGDGDGSRTESKQHSRASRTQAEQPPAGPTVEELRKARISLMGLNIPCGLGYGEGSSEAEAVAAATDNARAELASDVGVQAFRFADTYAQKVPAAARKTWEDRVKVISTVHVNAATPYKSAAVERDRETKVFKAHTLIILDPEKFKQALSDATTGNDQFNRHARKDLMLKKMDVIIADFNKKYRK